MSKTKMTYLKFTLSFILCVISVICDAQTKSTETRTINGKKYYIHKVEKGQSLYAISKVYNIDVNSILAENDEAIDGLKNGQELKIPFESLMPKTNLGIDTNKYVYHKILKGETIYSITKKFNIDEKKLASYNPTLNSGLKEGEYIIVADKKKVKPETTLSKKDTVFYTVSQGETLYSITKKFNVTQEEIIKWNTAAKEGIKNGQVLKILQTTCFSAVKPKAVPMAIIPNNEISLVIDTALFSKPAKSSYHIGLFLPFKLNETESINIDDLARSKSIFPATQSLALDFYAGLKKAIDSLSAKDFDLTLHVFDTEERDSLKIETLCKTEEFKKLDAIFGPLYLGIFKQVANKAKVLGIPIVSPLTQQNKILYNNPFASKVNPSQFTLIESLADYYMDSLMTNSNIILVNTNSPKDRQYVKAFKNHYNELLPKYNKSIKDTLTETKGLAGVKEAYVYGKKNVVVLLTNNLVYLQDFITQLYVFSDKKDITLFGFNSVSNIDNLDQDYLNKLHFHFAASDHINYKDSMINKMVKNYQEINFSDPSDYYFEAFDIGTYYLSHLKKHGPSFFLNLDKFNWTGSVMGFKYYRPDTETGFENRAAYIFKYYNYSLLKLGWK